MNALHELPASVAPPASPEVPVARVGVLADALATHGWAVTPDFFTSDEASALLADGLAHRAAFHRAGIGRAEQYQVQAAIRSDEVLWLEPESATPAQQVYLDRMADLQQALNRSLFLGLFSFEAHVAVYPPGAFYKRHLDAFRGHGKKRTLSCVLYLNDGWTDADGGHLRLYLDGHALEPFVDVRPEAGTLVTFLSDTFEHEVLPATRERASMTGWFSVRL